MRVAPPIDLTPEQKEALEQCLRARSLSIRLVERARIVLLAAAGKQDKDVAADLGISAQAVVCARAWHRPLVAGSGSTLDADAAPGTDRSRFHPEC
jgi:FixJ family two-component response regulator